MLCTGKREINILYVSFPNKALSLDWWKALSSWNQVGCLRNTLCTRSYRFVFYAICSRIALHGLVRIKRARLFYSRMTILSRRRTARFMTAIRACILLSTNDNLSFDVRPGFTIPLFSTSTFFHSHSRYISPYWLCQ